MNAEDARKIIERYRHLEEPIEDPLLREQFKRLVFPSLCVLNRAKGYLECLEGPEMNQRVDNARAEALDSLFQCDNCHIGWHRPSEKFCPVVVEGIKESVGIEKDAEIAGLKEHIEFLMKGDQILRNKLQDERDRSKAFLEDLEKIQVHLHAEKSDGEYVWIFVEDFRIIADTLVIAIHKGRQ